MNKKPKLKEIFNPKIRENLNDIIPKLNHIAPEITSSISAYSILEDAISRKVLVYKFMKPMKSKNKMPTFILG